MARPERSWGMLIVWTAAALTACSTSVDPLGRTYEPLSGSDAIARAQLWVTAEVPYCQSPNGQADPDTSCSPVCMRPTNANWDPYRSDCSGFVSWAWDLPAPGRTTDEFAPAVTDITEVIDGNDLAPGDALNVPGDHIILFVSWIVPGMSANFMEEPGCSATPDYAHSFTSNVEISGSSVTVDYEANTFTAIRYMGLTGEPDAGPPLAADAGSPTTCFVSSLGVSGVCMLTTACAALGNHTSTAGYCPGPNDIECCTANGCTSSAQCSGDTPVCDTATGACRACNSSTDCAMGVCATNSTDPSHGKCVQCTSDSECTSPAVCDLASDTCTRCQTNAQCTPLKPVCVTGTCAGCSTDSDCSGNPHGGVCQTSGAQAGACVTCTSADTSACGGATPVCDESFGMCVECVTSADCKDSANPICDTLSNTCGCPASDPTCARATEDGGTGSGNHVTSGEDGGPASASNTSAATGGCASSASNLSALWTLGMLTWRRRSRRRRPGPRPLLD